ncbi:hypothetical protein SAMN04489727_1971 [Amycolatopsis tolypomycina]|uniref:Uncharacterized protein n=1 Tax=Amycolatopsis tolypomycina TaxID=208445 RepID=A0A1H4JLL3_9PSEU|nr:hypothetical protein [Amycolatopsis tolypomycina]SEB46578.1 hypothetical protein SAMN04489727_1971 [Amycolatopsis tolypomycina]
MSIVISARDVPEIRARMAAWARDPGADGAANWFTFWLGPHPEQATDSRVFNRADDVSALISSTLAAQLPVAELFYVSDEMTDLAGHAATTLTDYRLHPEDLPAPVGIMVYAHPPVPGTATSSHDGLTVVSWGPGRGGLWVHTWASLSAEWTNGALRIGRVLAGLPHEHVLERAIRGSQHPLADPERNPPTTAQAADSFAAGLLPNLRRAPIPPSFSPAHGYEWRGLTPMEFTEMQGWPGYVASNGEGMDADAKIAQQRAILATWLMMGQTLVRSEQLTAPRAARRRIAREDPHLDPTVRYIDLRRARTEPPDHTAEESRTSTREYRHRWIVRGHWRNQFYPSRNDHRPIWIDPHLAGPEDKPLLGGERVNVLRR